MKKFNIPEINSVELAAVEAIMDSMLVKPNNSGEKTINYSITDAARDESSKQKYWADK